MSALLPSQGSITTEARGYRLVHQSADEPSRLNSELSLPSVSLLSYKQSLQEGRHAPAFLVRPPSGPQAGIRNGPDRDRQSSHEQASTAGAPFPPLAYAQRWLLGKPSDPAARPPVQSYTWQQSKRLVALTCGTDQVLVFDCTGPRDADGRLLQPAAVLEHDQQYQVSSVAWRPQFRPMLAVGCQQGICLWNLAGGQQAAGSNGSQGPPGAMTLLRTVAPPLWCRGAGAGARTWALEFSPNGALLAAASSDAPGVTIWDVARGEGVQVGCGTAAFGLLRWSPCGAYFFAAGLDNHFYIWETTGWTPQRWDLPSGDSITAAHWAPSGRTLLLAQAACPTLRTIHLLGDPPSLSTQAYDLLLPELWPADSAPDQPAPRQQIHSAAWDPSGTRLAVICPPTHPPAAPSIALYATNGAATAGTPIDATFIGYVQAPLPEDARIEDLEVQVVAASSRTLLLLLRSGENLLHTVPLHL